MSSHHVHPLSLIPILIFGLPAILALRQNGMMRDNSPSDDAMADQHMGVGRYLATRLPTLKPPMAKAPNPFKLLRLLNAQQWLFFLVAFLAWSWDAFDFFTVSLTVSELSKQFDKTTAQITWGITLVLMFRSVGAVIFGESPNGKRAEEANIDRPLQELQQIAGGENGLLS